MCLKRYCPTNHGRKASHRTGTRREPRKLIALELYTDKYSDTEIIPLRSLKSETYQIMALKITTKYGDKFIMIHDDGGLLKACYSNKYLEDWTQEFL